MGNKGVIGPGDVQWMTAGSGIIHQEMPKGDETGRMGGFQLWANLPASHKMMEPRYRDVKSSQIPELRTARRRNDPDHLRQGRRDRGAGPGHRHRSGVPRRDAPGGDGVHPPDPAGTHRLRLRDRRPRHFLRGEEPVFLRGRGEELFRHQSAAPSRRTESSSCSPTGSRSSSPRRRSRSASS